MYTYIYSWCEPRSIPLSQSRRTDLRPIICPPSFCSSVPAYSGDFCEPILSEFAEYDTPALLLVVL